jgi:MHS family alpha-ketoglutarate permease-like MFS transporter
MTPEATSDRPYANGVPATAANADGHDGATPRSRVKAILVGSIGNLIEWYDVYAYTAFALYFAPAFFPSADPVAQQLSAAAVFAAAFVVRPLGGLLFGWIADRYGRRRSLMVSVLLMCFGSLLIAVSPTHADIGAAAAGILVAARLLQGLSQGGEYGASATYLAEMAGPKQRGFYSGVWYTTLIGGQLMAIVLLLVLQKVFLTPEELRAWGWRIPFAIGALLSVYALFMRREMHETDHYQAAQVTPGVADTGTTMPAGRGDVVTRSSTMKALLTHWRELLLVVGITIGGTSAFYTYTTYMQKFLKLSVGLDDGQVTMVVLGYLVVALLLQPVYGALSDRIGRKPLLLWFGILGVLCTVPLLTTLSQVKSPWLAWLLICGAWVIVSGYTSITGIIKAELFPTSVRALGVGVPYALTVSVFGGTVDAVALAFKQAGHESGFYWYATACIAVSLVVYLRMPDTLKASRMEQHH